MSLTHVDPHVSEIVMVWIQSGDLLMVWIQISLFYMHTRQDEPYHQVFLLRVHTAMRHSFSQNSIETENAPFSMDTNSNSLA
jgi:hypothetical protein